MEKERGKKKNLGLVHVMSSKMRTHDADPGDDDDDDSRNSQSQTNEHVHKEGNGGKCDKRFFYL